MRTAKHMAGGAAKWDLRLRVLQPGMQRTFAEPKALCWRTLARTGLRRVVLPSSLPPASAGGAAMASSWCSSRLPPALLPRTRSGVIQIAELLAPLMRSLMRHVLWSRILGDVDEGVLQALT